MVFSDPDHLGQPALAVAYLDAVAEKLAALKVRLLELLSPSPGSCVLDVGCGAGHDLVALAEREVMPVGIDFSEHMVRASRQRCDTGGVVAHIVRADGMRLPLRSGAVDACRIERVLQHVDQPLSVLQEVFRVLRPAGPLVVFEPDWNTFSSEADDTELSALVCHVIASHVRQPRIGSNLGALLREAGFRSVGCIPDRVEWSSLASLTQGVGVEPILERARRKGLIDADGANRWMAEMKDRSAEGRFRATLDRVIASASRPQRNGRRADRTR